MPASYEKLGIRFNYPENWAVDEEEARSTGNAVTVYSPGGAFWTVNIQPGDADRDKLAQTIIETMRSEYGELDIEPISETVDGWDLSGFDLNFYCLDLTNTAQLRTVLTPRGTLVIMAQAEDREFQRISEVFRAITVSLLRQSL